MRIRTTRNINIKINSHTLFKSSSYNFTGYKITATFSQKKVHCSQVSKGNKNRLDHESFYQSNIKKLLHLSPEDCKKRTNQLNLTTNKGINQKLVNFQVFPDYAHQEEIERYQGHIKLDDKYPLHGAHGRLTYELHDNNWKPQNRINNPSNCEAVTKLKGYQEFMFFDGEIQLEKVQVARNLKADSIFYQGIRFFCKTDQGYCDTATRTQATLVWFPEDTCTTFQVAIIHTRMIKFHQKHFNESIPFDKVNPGKFDKTINVSTISII